MTGTSRNGNLLAAGLIALSICLTGTPASAAGPGREIPAAPHGAGANGDISREVEGGTEVPCGTSVPGAVPRSRSADQSVGADPEDRGPRPPRATGEEPRPVDAPCSIETLRKRAAKAGIS